MIIYRLLLNLILPFALLRLFYRSLKLPSYRQRWWQRLGFLPALPQRAIWIHAVSVGESQAIAPLVQRLLQAGEPIIISTTTPTGAERVRKLFGDQVDHIYFPYDVGWIVQKVLHHLQPRLLILVETEIWPNLIWRAHQQRTPILLANARLSERSARRYARFQLSRRILPLINCIAAQSAADAQRFIDLGYPKERIQITGSIKFDRRISASSREQSSLLRHQWGDRPIWIAASTHEGEEEILLRVQRQLLAELPQVLLVLVPRHPERFNEVAELIAAKHFHYARRTTDPAHAQIQVYLGDTMGELPALIGASDVAFIGGSLVPVGGHNPLEAAAQGVPVLFGPHMFNFASIADLLLEAGAAVQVQNEKQLLAYLQDWLSQAQKRTPIGEKGRQLVQSQQGALDRLHALVQKMK